MDVAFLNYAITAAIGFAISGVLMSGYSLIAGKPLGFAFAPDQPNAQIPLQILLRLAAGPAILVRNIFTMEDDSFSLTVAGVMTASVWSLGCGALVIQTLGFG